MVPTALEEIRDVFAILHDGVISSWRGDKHLLILQIECRYLAERINKSYQNFFVEIAGIETFKFEPWMDQFQSQKLFTDFERTFQDELMILDSSIEEEHVKISCSPGEHRNIDLNYSGGNLRLAGNAIQIFDEGHCPISIDALDIICKQYWNELARATHGE